MASLTLTVVNVIKQNGKLFVEWSDGIQQEFSSLSDAQSRRDSLSQDIEVLRKMALARYLRIDPTANNPSVIEGHSITYDDTLNTMVTVT